MSVYTYVGNKRFDDFRITKITVRPGLELDLGESADLTEAEYKAISKRFKLVEGADVPPEEVEDPLIQYIRSEISDPVGPPVTRGLVSNSFTNPKGFNNTTNWIAGAGSAMTRVTDAELGPGIRWTRAAGDCGGYFAMTGSSVGSVGVTPGNICYVRCRAKVEDGAPCQIGMSAIFYTAANLVLALETLDLRSTIVDGEDYILEGFAQVPATAAFVAASPLMTGATGTQSLFVTEAQVIPDITDLAEYGDGDSLGWFWNGTPHAASSFGYVDRPDPSIHFGFNDASVDDPKPIVSSVVAARLHAESGSDIVRIGLDMSAIINGSSWDWTALGYDEHINAIIDEGLKIMPIFGGWDVWPGPPPTGAELETHLDAYADFITRWGNHIGAVEILNEPNLSFFWGEQPINPEAAAELTNAIAGAVRTAGFEGKIIGPAVSHRQTDDITAPNYAMDTAEFMQRFLAAGGAESLDGISVHPYGKEPVGTGDPAGGDFSKGTASVLLQIDKAQQAAEINLPVWITEYGWSTTSGSAGQPNQRQQATGLVLMGQIAQRRGFGGYFVHGLLAESNDAASGKGYEVVDTPGLGRKPSFVSLASWRQVSSPLVAPVGGATIDANARTAITQVQQTINELRGQIARLR